MKRSACSLLLVLDVTYTIERERERERGRGRRKSRSTHKKNSPEIKAAAPENLLQPKGGGIQSVGWIPGEPVTKIGQTYLSLYLT
jgi:hypothetical protein